MAGYRRFYNYGVEHALHLEEIERSASRHKNFSVRSQQGIGVVRRMLARTLMKLAQWIDPAAVPHGKEVMHVV